MRYKIFSEGTGLKVSELALGPGMFGQAWGYGATPDEVSRVITGFADAGGNFIDIADNYQHGVSETLVGEAIAANRDDCIIATKFTRGASAKPAILIELNFELTLGFASETFTVEAGAPLLNTQSGAVSTVIDHAFVDNFPRW